MAISIDTRTLRPGDTYVAIRGELHDGHDFVPAAIEAGASSVVVERWALEANGIEVPPTVAVLAVDDTVGYLTESASARLRDGGVDVVAITGSVGKTTTKGAVVAVLAQAFPVVFAEGNLNTPLGLSLMVLNAEFHPGTKVVMEMGARVVGDIAELVRLFPPTVSVVTAVKGVHLETFGTIERIDHEKGQLVVALRAGDVAVLNADDPRVAAMSQRTAARCIRYGRADDADIGPSVITVDLPILGDHAISTALAAYAVGEAFGMDAAAINRGLSLIVAEPGRLVRLQGRNDSTLIDDTYNASPDATLAALRVLAAEPATRRLAYVGDMLELGPDEIADHVVVLNAALDVADGVAAVGPRMAAAARRVRKARPELEGSDRLVGFDSSGELADAIGSDRAPQSGDAVLVKGSQGMRMERVSEALLHPGLDPADVLTRQTIAWKQK